MKTAPRPNSSAIWEKAASMLDKQAALADRLLAVFESKPKSGLYDDEKDCDFGSFVRHIRGALSLSPRTVLRAALNEGFHQLCSLPSSSSDAQSMSELLHFAQLPSRIHELARAVSLMSPGECYAKLQHAVQDLEQHRGTDPNSIYAKIHAKIGSTTTKAELETIYLKVRAKHEKRTTHLEERASRLNADVALDPVFMKYSKVHELWEGTGAKSLWERFLEVDLQLCRLRNQQGATFESQQELVFAMIALQMAEDKLVSPDEFQYACNVNWWDGQEAVGEIDLVVLHGEKVVAVCEMKSSCFLLSQAIRQHEQKIASCGNAPGASSVGIGKTPCRLFPISDRVQLFVATSAPDMSTQNHLLGAEPLVCTAIGDGIREQGLFIANETTKMKSAPLIDTLLGSEEKTQEEIIQYLSSCSEQTGESKDPVDLPRLAKFVDDRLADTLSRSLSPAGCFCKWRQNILILD